MKSTIFVVTHKQAVIPLLEDYKVIVVGDNSDIYYPDAYYDKNGKSIARKNANYCELTAHYWVLNNYLCVDDYIGMVHYRRFFLFGKDILKADSVPIIMKRFDCILPQKNVLPCSVYNYYFDHGFGRKKDIDLMIEIIEKKYPQYIKATQKVLHSNRASYCNMYIMKNADFQAYNKWLFDILDELERKIDISDYSKQEARIFGYLSEILINIWVENQFYKVKYLPVFNTEDSQHFLKKIKKVLINIKNDFTYRKTNFFARKKSTLC